MASPECACGGGGRCGFPLASAGAGLLLPALALALGLPLALVESSSSDDCDATEPSDSEPAPHDAAPAPPPLAPLPAADCADRADGDADDPLTRYTSHDHHQNSVQSTMIRRCNVAKLTRWERECDLEWECECECDSERASGDCCAGEYALLSLLLPRREPAPAPSAPSAHTKRTSA